MRKGIRSSSAPAPVGPYSPAIEAGGLVWASGQIPLDPATGRLVEGGIEAQAERALANLEAVLGAAGTSLRQAVRVTLYLVDLGDFDAVNRVYERFFEEPAPARVCVEVAGLPRGARIEVDAVALSARPS